MYQITTIRQEEIKPDFFCVLFSFFLSFFFFFCQLFFSFSFFEFFLQETMYHLKLEKQKVDENNETKVQSSLVGTAPTCDKTRYQYVILETEINMEKKRKIRKPIAPALIPIDVIFPDRLLDARDRIDGPRPVVYKETRTLV